MRYAVWCKTTEAWVRDHNREYVWYVPTFKTKAAAKRDMKTWCVPCFMDDYEIRPYGSVSLRTRPNKGKEGWDAV